MYVSPNQKINSNKYYKKLLSDPERLEKRNAYRRELWHKHKERINKDRKEKYMENRDDNLVKKNNYWNRTGGKMKIKSDGLTVQQYRTRANFIKKMKSLQMVSGLLTPRCCKCGESDPMVLCINHINGGGLKDIRENGKANMNVLVANGRMIDDLDVRCYNCNIKYEYEQGRRFIPISFKEIYDDLTCRHNNIFKFIDEKYGEYIPKNILTNVA